MQDNWRSDTMQGTGIRQQSILKSTFLILTSNQKGLEYGIWGRERECVNFCFTEPSSLVTGEQWT